MGAGVGIDIGSSSVKAVSVQRAGTGYRVKALSMAEIRRPEFAPQEEGVVDPVEATRRALDRIAETRALAKAECASSTSGAKVAARMFSFPKMDERDVAAAVRIEAEQVIPFDLADAVVDYVRFADRKEDGALLAEGIVVASQREDIDKKYNLLRSKGYDPVIFDIDSLAIANAYAATHDLDPDEGVAIVNIGARTSNLAILVGYDRVFVRDIAAAGDLVSRAISELYGLDLGSAEAQKRELKYDAESEGTFTRTAKVKAPSMPPKKSAQGAASQGDATHVDDAPPVHPAGDELLEEELEELDDFEEVMESRLGDVVVLEEEQAAPIPRPATAKKESAEATVVESAPVTANPVTEESASGTAYAILRESLGELVTEIRDTFKYYSDKRVVPRISRIVITGGTSKLPQIAEYFAHELHADAEIWDPLESLDCSTIAKRYPPEMLKEIGPYMAVAVGLALRKV